MARTTSLSTRKSKIFDEVFRHSQIGFQETDRRATGRNRVGTISFNEADELFRSWLDEANWPYEALMFDPRSFTFLFEKTSRLIANKLRGHLVPREGSDVIAAKINNAILDYQWDKATTGGTMLSKWALKDITTRKYGAAFSLHKWRYQLGKDGRVLFDGPEMKFLENRDCAHDLTATSIEDCNWFQVREYVTFQELLSVNDRARTKPIYQNLERLREAIGNEDNTGGGDTRGVNWFSRNRAIAGLETDPVGKDPVFKTVEIITEYRRDQWITFAPKHGVVLRDIENPYKNNEIPVVMLRYYVIDDDLYGLSELEPVKGPQKAINALLSQYVDEVNQKLYTPIAVGPGVRQHTLEWGKGARWIMNNPMTDYRLVESSSNAAAYFNQTYSVLVASMMNALGETSLGISNLGPYQKEKTATEVRTLTQQRNARDNFNQIFLAEAIGRQMMLWYSMNQQFLFADPKKKEYIVRIVGKDSLEFFRGAGLHEMDIDKEKEKEMELTGETKVEDFLVPRFPVNVGTKENPNLKPKLKVDEYGEGADLFVEPEDLKGNYDFIADVESMALNTEDTLKGSRQQAITLLVSNPNVLQLLTQEGVKPKFKDLFVSWLEDSGFKDADKYFESVPVNSQAGNIPMTPPSIAQASAGGQPGLPPMQTNGQSILSQGPSVPPSGI